MALLDTIADLSLNRIIGRTGPYSYTAALFDTRRQDEGIEFYETTLASDSNAYYAWADGGNYSCDCNRSLFTQGEELDCNTTDEGQVILLVALRNNDTERTIVEPPAGCPTITWPKREDRDGE